MEMVDFFFSPLPQTLTRTTKLCSIPLLDQPNLIGIIMQDEECLVKKSGILFVVEKNLFLL